MADVNLVSILRHLEAHAATLVHLRAGNPPAFWKGNQRLDDHGELGALSADVIRRTVCVPLTDEQLRDYRRRTFASVDLSIRDLGAFHFEAYVQAGLEEIVITSAPRRDRWALFRDHAELLATAQQSPDDADTYWNLGVAFIEAGEHQLAWHAFERALALEPNDPSIHFEIAKLLGRDLRRVDDAIAVLERAIGLPDAAAEVHFELAALLRSSNRLEAAESAVRRGLDAHRDHGPLLEALGVLLIELDRPAEATQVLERCLELHGPDPEIQALLTRARSDRG